MKILVAYYSRTKNTQKVAKQITKLLNADLEEIIDEKDRKRKIIGWIIAGGDALKRKLTKIKYIKDPKKYDLVIVGTPIWAWTMTPAIRTYLTKNKLKSVAFFCTSAGQKGSVFVDMEKLSTKPKITLELIDKQIDSEESLQKIKDFCKKIKA